MKRWTNKELAEINDFYFAQAILNERKAGLNPYTPLAKKLAKAAKECEALGEKLLGDELFASPARMMDICNAALTQLAEEYSGSELYNILSDTLEMTDEEISAAGFTQFDNQDD